MTPAPEPRVPARRRPRYGLLAAASALLLAAALLPWPGVPRSGAFSGVLAGLGAGGLMVSLNLILPSVRSGQGHVLALSATERSPALPDTPLMQETLPGVYINSWTGYFAPAKTPR